MLDEYDINDIINEVSELETQINENIIKTNLIIIKVDDDKIENIIKKKQNFKDNIITRKLLNGILNKINEEYCKNEYEIKYLLNFEVIKNIDEIENLDIEDLMSDKNYNLNILKNIQSINNINIDEVFFRNANSLIFILNKLEPTIFIKIKGRKQNATKKLRGGRTACE
jgi:hypothetical protein